MDTFARTGLYWTPTSSKQGSCQEVTTFLKLILIDGQGHLSPTHVDDFALAAFQLFNYPNQRFRHVSTCFLDCRQRNRGVIACACRSLREAVLFECTRVQSNRAFLVGHEAKGPKALAAQASFGVCLQATHRMRNMMKHEQHEGLELKAEAARMIQQALKVTTLSSLPAKGLQERST